MRFLHLVASAALVGLCGCPEPDPIPDGPPPTPTVSVTWKLADPGDLELSCEAVDAQFVTMSSMNLRTGRLSNELFDCFRKTGTLVLERGDYMIGFDLADRFGTLVTVPLRRYSITEDAALDDVKFTLDPRGTLVWNLDAVGPPANCGGGAQITGMSIEMYQANGNCQSNTLSIEGGGTYAVNCAAPSVTSCIEQDRDITGAGLPAGEYRIRVVGLSGANSCWLHDQRHRVRAAGLSRSVVLALAKTCN